MIVPSSLSTDLCTRVHRDCFPWPTLVNERECVESREWSLITLAGRCGIIPHIKVSRHGIAAGADITGLDIVAV